MGNNIVVVYHAHCDDGFGAAWVAHRKFGASATYLPMSYGDTPPSVKGADVFILDFSFTPDVVRRLAEESEKLILLDHHKSAREQWIPFSEDPSPVWATHLPGNSYIEFDMNHSGAMLAWNYFFPEEEPPLLVKLIQDNDLWRFEFPETKCFIRALRSYERSFKKWDEIDDTSRNTVGYLSLLHEGQTLERNFKKLCNDLLDQQPPHKVYLTDVSGKVHPGLAVNAPGMFASDVGNILAEMSGTCGVVYWNDADNTHYSLRSIGDFDVSLIANRFGGGGHRNAAGFVRPKSEDSWAYFKLGYCENN